MQSVRAFVHLYPLQFRKVFLMVSFKRMEETEDRRGGRRMGREKEGRRGGEETPATPLSMGTIMSPGLFGKGREVACPSFARLRF